LKTGCPCWQHNILRGHLSMLPTYRCISCRAQWPQNLVHRYWECIPQSTHHRTLLHNHQSWVWWIWRAYLCHLQGPIWSEDIGTWWHERFADCFLSLSSTRPCMVWGHWDLMAWVVCSLPPVDGFPLLQGWAWHLDAMEQWCVWIHCGICWWPGNSSKGPSRHHQDLRREVQLQTSPITFGVNSGVTPRECFVNLPGSILRRWSGHISNCLALNPPQRPYHHLRRVTTWISKT